ncbi:MAG: glycosyltransferase [Desulfobacterales bacterium]
MNILFCSEGFIVDGVASYNLYLAAALSRAGHTVAIVGRWAGFNGFQVRHRTSGVSVIQRLSTTVDSARLVKAAIQFKPDVLITDARRSFPLARRIQTQTGAKVVTIFHDPPQFERKGNRSIDTIIAGSDVWITAEKSIHEALTAIDTDLSTHWIQRPLTGMIQPKPLPPEDPFNVLCLGRLSRWKSPGLRTIVDRALDLKQAIPSLTITIVGGGRRQLNFRLSAAKANLRAGERFVRIVGTQTNPQPWIQQANVVCAGATAAVEAILSERPVLAFSGFWLGRVTPENLDRGVATHFGERKGDFYVRDDPGVVITGLIDLYRQWDQEEMADRVIALRKQLSPAFDSIAVADAFQAIFDKF